ncbi:hypothetical protein JJE66_34265 [Bradyrhizobium diazoefficiens]|uniref:hypothetical protein n=1 Tax=Bradyrhizobium diazoefficiens TaxID=1355477 RepID=UPI00190D464D|nr:hypothetical protein [Bradyrhizobium diazoefficiens]MBK3666270.1 hypothetical protein [Bradyrhizobium diazoefficiens]
MARKLACFTCGLMGVLVLGAAVWARSNLLDPFLTVDVPTLLLKSSEYEGRRITVRGVVDVNAGILGRGMFKLRQNGSDLWVLTDRGVPSEGQIATVHGTFKQGVKLGSVQLPILLQD